MRLLIAVVLGWTLASFAEAVTDSGSVSAPSLASAADTSATWKIGRIAVQGNQTVDIAVLKGAVRMAEGDVLGFDALQDRQRESIRALLATGLLSDASVEYRETSPGVVDAVVIVRELPLCGNVRYSGFDAVAEKDLKEVCHVQDGSMLSQSNLEKDRQAMLKIYHDKGYLLAAVVPIRGEMDSLTGKVSLTWKINEKSKVRVGKILFSGNKRVSSKKLMGTMATKEKRWWRSGEYNRDTLLQDLQKIQDLYREKGYLDGAVDSHSVAYRPDSTRLDIRLVIHEGRRYYRGRVSFQGEDVLTERQLLVQTLLDSGDILNQKKLDAELQNIQAAYRDEGRIYAQVNPVKTYRDDSIVDMLYMIKEGAPATVGQVIVEGNTKTRDKVIRREIKLFPGDLFRQSLLMRSYREVMQLNFFDNVVPDIQPSSQDGVVDLVFKVAEKEKGTGTFSAGASYSQSDGFTGTLGLQIPNVMGTGRLVSTNFEYGQYKKSSKLGFSEPWLMDSPTKVGVDAFWTHQKDQYDSTYDYITTGFDLSAGRRLTWPDDYFSTSLGYGLSYTRYEGTSSDKTGIVRTDGYSSSISLTVSRDDKDLPMFPTNGSTFQWSISRVGGPLGGDFDYTQGTASAKWWFPLVGKFVLNVEMQGGMMDGKILQTGALYREGGILGYQGKLRGYDAASIGLYRVGRSYFSSTAEVRYPVADQLFYLIGFMDAGNVYGKALRKDVDRTVLTLPDPWEEIDLGNLKRDWGFGFRLQIPMMGVLGFDFAWGLDPAEGTYGVSESNTGMHANFAIEQSF